MPGRGHLDAAAPSMWALLTGLGGRHRLKLALTYALTLAENGLNILYPFLTGIAIDALLAGRWVGMAPLLIAWTVHLAVGLFRHVYDTRVFTLVYADLAADLVERQRAQGTNAAHLAARVALSCEIVDFLQVRSDRM
jgi:ABC transporter transmembrane region